MLRAGAQGGGRTRGGYDTTMTTDPDGLVSRARDFSSDGGTVSYDEIRYGAWVAELSGLLDLTGWPPGLRAANEERPHPGAQLRLTDADGLRVTAFATTQRSSPRAWCMTATA